MPKTLRGTLHLRSGPSSVPWAATWRWREEIAYGVIYHASDEASYVTGSELIIDAPPPPPPLYPHTS